MRKIVCKSGDRMHASALDLNAEVKCRGHDALGPETTGDAENIQYPRNIQGIKRMQGISKEHPRLQGISKEYPLN